jgi:catechol-2,3-dioxygenase
MSALPHINTYGLTHLAVAVKDLKRTLAFYQGVFGARVMYQEANWAQVSTPGANDIIVFEEKPELAGKSSGGIMHFGFRLKEKSDFLNVKEILTRESAEIIEAGEFVSGEPFIFFSDPDGYKIEVWYEKDIETAK